MVIASSVLSWVNVKKDLSGDVLFGRVFFPDSPPPWLHSIGHPSRPMLRFFGVPPFSVTDLMW